MDLHKTRSPLSKMIVSCVVSVSIASVVIAGVIVPLRRAGQPPAGGYFGCDLCPSGKCGVSRRANSLEAALLMVRAEPGVAIIPEFLRDKVPDRVVTVPTRGWQMVLDQFVAVSRRGPKPSQVEAFWNGIATSHTLWEQMERMKER